MTLEAAKSMQTLVVVGNDKLGRRLLARLGDHSKSMITLDHSASLKRTWRLLRRGSLKVSWLFRMAIAELTREDTRVTITQHISSNTDLLRIIRHNNIDQVYLFRAGLIVNRKVLDCGVQILNTHCGRIPDYGGLGAIPRALAEKAYDQVATLHRVTVTIDDGEVLDVEPYLLNPDISYRENEDTAYEAGIRLLLRHLRNGS
jgi:methionyl-tRNA formyltransferase